ncbi:MAG: PEP-CTERM sorting domain-containing protein [Leptolyngbyaceae cyanobacterium]
MMPNHTFVALIGSTTLIVGAAIAPAQAFVVAPSNITDQQFNQLILDGDFSELFVAESRAGFTGSERELGINDALVPNAGGTGLIGGLPLAAGQLDWTSGETVEFHLSYNALTGEVAYTVNGELLNATVNAESPNGIYIRTNAQGKDTGSNATTSSSMSLENLMLDDGNGFEALPDLASFFTQGGPRDVDYLVISDLSGSFSLKGEQTLSWAGQFPDRSRLAAQIKVGSFNDSESVPEPATLLGAMVALGAGYSLKRRRDQATA